MTPDTLASFFGWCTIINAAGLLLAALALLGMRGPITRIHAKMTGLSEADLARAYFQFLSHYKIAILVFNLVPYFALKLSA